MHATEDITTLHLHSWALICRKKVAGSLPLPPLPSFPPLSVEVGLLNPARWSEGAL